MFNKSALLFVGSLSILAAANPVVPRQTSQCNTGSTQCCNSVTSSNDPATSSLLGLLGIIVQGVTVGVGVSCTPISVVGVASGTNCAQQPACCTGNQQFGLVNLGCTPISL